MQHLGGFQSHKSPRLRLKVGSSEQPATHRLWRGYLTLFICLCLAFTAGAASKKKTNASVKPVVAVKPVSAPQPVATVQTDAGDIDRRIEAAEAEATKLTSTLTLLSQDSIRVAGEMAGKLQPAAGSQLLEGQIAQKTQEVSALRLTRDKARQDSIAAAAKLGERFQGIKREAARLDAAVMSASNQLNALSSRRQQIPAEGGGEGNKAVTAAGRDLTRLDSLMGIKQAEIAAGAKKRDQLRQDSLSLEARVSEARNKIAGESRRIDSLLQIANAEMNEAAAKQAKSRPGSSSGSDQAKLGELTKQKAQLDAQIAQAKAEIAAATADRERLRGASTDADKKIVQDRAPLADALADAEAQLSAKAGDREVLMSLIEKVQLDSAITKNKDALNSAIEKKAMNKKGADQLVNQYESEVSRLMGRLDDIKRKYPKMLQYESKITGATTTAEKRKQIEMFIASVKGEVVSQTSRRDLAKRNLDNFDRTHPSPAKAWAPRLGQLDSTVAVKQKLTMELAARRDSLENQIVMLRRTVEGFNTAVQEEARRSDSAAVVAKKRRSDLSLQRAQVRGDSLKNESTLSVGLARLRSEQAKVSGQTSALEREVSSSTASKERLKRTIADAQNREEQSKVANQAERKRLDSLVTAKEQEVAQLSMQNEKISQELQSASRDNDQELQKQGAAIASIAVKVTAAEQELNALKSQVEAARKDRAALEKAYVDTLKGIGRDINAVRASISGKKNEITALRNQRATGERTLKGEIARLDSMITAEGRSIAGLETDRDKARQDSMATESSKSDASLRSAQALRRQDSLIAELQNQLTGCVTAVEKARTDSVASSVVVTSVTLQAVKTLDSVIALREREIADLRQQREKARQEAMGEKQKYAASLSAAHQNIMNQRMIAQRKQADITSLQSQRVRLQQDSAGAMVRIQSAAHLKGTEITRQNMIIAGKKEKLAAMQTQRSAMAGKLQAFGGEAPAPAAASSGTAGQSGGAGNAEAAAQKLVEEIYILIGSDKIDEAVSRFNSGRSLLSENVNSDAFQVLKYAVDQAIETRKKGTEKK